LFFCEGALKTPPKSRTPLGKKILLDDLLGMYHHRVEDKNIPRYSKYFTEVLPILLGLGLI
jgi:hypothetical protein